MDSIMYCRTGQPPPRHHPVQSHFCLLPQSTCFYHQRVWTFRYWGYSTNKTFLAKLASLCNRTKNLVARSNHHLLIFMTLGLADVAWLSHGLAEGWMGCKVWDGLTLVQLLVQTVASRGSVLLPHRQAWARPASIHAGPRTTFKREKGEATKSLKA